MSNKQRIFHFYILFLLMLAYRNIQGALNQTQRQDILNAHNEARQNVDPPAEIMPDLVWNSELESVAQAYSAGCVMGHNDNRSAQYEKGYVGENVAAGSGNVKSLVGLWVGEKNDGYSYYNGMVENFDCCGHYTQVIWAKSTSIGCGWAQGCPIYGNYLVCDYFPGGNSNYEKPYVNGTKTNGNDSSNSTNNDNSSNNNDRNNVSNDNNNDNNKKSKGGAVAAVVIIVLLVIISVAVVAVVVIVYRRKKVATAAASAGGGEGSSINRSNHSAETAPHINTQRRELYNADKEQSQSQQILVSQQSYPTLPSSLSQNNLYPSYLPSSQQNTPNSVGIDAQSYNTNPPPQVLALTQNINSSSSGSIGTRRYSPSLGVVNSHVCAVPVNPGFDSPHLPPHIILPPPKFPPK